MKEPTSILDYKHHSDFLDDERPAFKEGEKAQHELGVLYQGPWERGGDGFSEHVRRCALALASTGCPVHLRSLRPTTQGALPDIDDDIRNQVGALADANLGRYSAQVQQIVLTKDLIQNLVRHPRLSDAENKVINHYRVISTVLERDRVGKAIASALKRVRQVWVACRENIDTFEASGIPRDRLRFVPLPYFDNDPLLTLRGRVRRPGVPRFYHIGKWEPRKAQDQIILAFMLAFKAGQAHLVMKISSLVTPPGDYPPDPQTAIFVALENDSVKANGWTAKNWKSSIEIISSRLSTEAIRALHRFGDVYVTLSRGEGFDMPAFDARLAGNLLVYTPSGGPQDFASEKDVMVPKSGLVTCHPMYGWEGDACYLDFDVRTAAEAMVKATEASVDPVRLDVPEDYRAENVGRSMLANLGEVAERVF